MVTDAATPLETDTSSRGTVVSSNQIVNLPLNGRSYADLALLAPGVRKSSIATGSTPRDASFNVNGMRSSLNNFVIDGVDNNAYGTSNQGFSNQVVQLSPDAVQEFRIETTSYSAEFGRAGGGIINASIRSGTNSFHGSAWEYLRNTELNATGFFKPVNNQKPVLIQNQFGAAFGGPVIRNKAFFFMDYEGFRRVQRRVTFSTLPTLEQRTGNLGIPVRNPYTGEVYSNGVIPSTAITRFAREVLAGLPAPNLPGLANNFQSQPAQTDNSDKGDVRYDHYLGRRLNVFARYSHRELNQFVPPSIPGPSGGDSNGNVRVNNKQIACGNELYGVADIHVGGARRLFAQRWRQIPYLPRRRRCGREVRHPERAERSPIHRRNLSTGSERVYGVRCSEQQSAVPESGRIEPQSELSQRSWALTA